MKRAFLILTLALAAAQIALAGSQVRSGGGGGAAAFPSKAWVDSVNGNDSTGALQREDKPYGTISAAFTAAAGAGGDWYITIMSGSYNSDNNLVPSGTNYNIVTYWMPGTTWTPTSSASLYNLTAMSADKPLYILGHGRFYGSNSGNTGKFIDSTYGATTIERFVIEAERIEAGNAGGFFNLRATLHGVDQVNSSVYPPRNELRVGTFAAANNNFHYFRLASSGAAPFIFVNCNYIGGIAIDEGNFIVECGYAEAFSIGPNGFSPNESLFLHCKYRFKGTSQPALLIRTGSADITARNLEVTDGSAPIIKFPSNSYTTTTTDAPRVTVRGGRMKMWAGGAAPAILFDATSANIKLRLIGATTFLFENTATQAIATTGSNAQTIEAFGTLDTTLALDSDITVRGVTPTVNASYWTDF